MSLDDLVKHASSDADDVRESAMNGQVPRGFYRQTDVGNAERFRDQHRGKVLYVPEWRSWIIWTGRRWERDLGTLRTLALAKATAVSIYDELDLAKRELQSAAWQDDDGGRSVLNHTVTGLLKHAQTSSAENKLRAMLSLAQAEKGMSASASDLDQSTRILNTPTGIVDLNTGSVSKHDPTTLCTRITEAAYDPEMPTPFWAAFLATVFGGDADLTRYFQRLVGLALVGNVGERVLPMCYGAGANGKTALFNGLRRRLGDYALTGDAAGILMGRDDDRPNEHVADLAGARLVVLPELPNGRLNETKLKRLTGGDALSAHRKYEHAVEWQPTHTFFVCMNRRPEVRETGRAMWDRMKLLPFLHTFMGDERLPLEQVMEKLAAEAPGILAWCVKGAVDYLAHGLGDEPESVRAATGEYQADEDMLGQFLAERTITDGETWTATAALYKAYTEWCEEAGHTRHDKKIEFAKELVRRGIEAKPGSGGKRGFRGIRIEGTLA